MNGSFIHDFKKMNISQHKKNTETLPYLMGIVIKVVSIL